MVLLLSLGACGLVPEPPTLVVPTERDPTALPTEQPGKGWVRVLNLSPSAGPVDVFIDGAQAAEGLPYLAGTAYAALRVGEHALAFHDGTGIATVSVDVVEDGWSSVTLYGPDPRVMVLADDRGDVAAGTTRVQLAHATAAWPPADLWELPGAGHVAGPVSYGQVTQVDVPSGAHTVELDLDEDGATDEVYTLPDLPSGSIVNLYLTCASDTPFLVAHDAYGVATAVSPGPKTRVRMLHAAPGAAPLAFAAGGTPIAASVPFEEGTRYAAVPPGPYTLEVGDAITLDRDLADDVHTTVVAWGWNGDRSLVVEEEHRYIDVGDVRLKVIHAGDGLGVIDLVETYGGASFVRGLAPGSARQIDIPPGPYTFGVDDDGDGGFEATFEVPYLGTQEVVEMVIIKQDGVPKLILFFADGTSWFLQPEGW